MVGRAVNGNPWFFNPHLSREEITLRQALEVMLEHTELYIRLMGELARLERMRKHFKAYIAGFPNVSSLRRALMAVQSLPELRSVVDNAVDSEAGTLARQDSVVSTSTAR